MTQIKLNYTEVMSLAQRLKNNARDFQANQRTLVSEVNNLNDNWSGAAAAVMQNELRDMNKFAIDIQASLQGMADFVETAAEALRTTDAGIIT